MCPQLIQTMAKLNRRGSVTWNPLQSLGGSGGGGDPAGGNGPRSSRFSISVQNQYPGVKYAFLVLLGSLPDANSLLILNTVIHRSLLIRK